MIKLILKTGEKDSNGKEKVIEQSVKAHVIPAFTRHGFSVVKEDHTIKEIKAWLKKANVKDIPEKATLEQLVKLI